MTQDECCPKFEVEKWDQKTFNWRNKPFIKETIPTFFHIPFPPMIGKKIKKMYNLAVTAKAEPPIQEWLVLFRDPTPFKSELYMSVTKPVDKENNTTITGKFETKVFDGPYNAIPKFIKEMEKYLAKKGLKPKDYYVHYAFCPNCAKKFNHNYMILFAEV